jgi:hypothetical protein
MPHRRNAASAAGRRRSSGRSKSINVQRQPPIATSCSTCIKRPCNVTVMAPIASSSCSTATLCTSLGSTPFSFRCCSCASNSAACASISAIAFFTRAGHSIPCSVSTASATSRRDSAASLTAAATDAVALAEAATALCTAGAWGSVAACFATSAAAALAVSSSE